MSSKLKSFLSNLKKGNIFNNGIDPYTILLYKYIETNTTKTKLLFSSFLMIILLPFTYFTFEILVLLVKRLNFLSNSSLELSIQRLEICKNTPCPLLPIYIFKWFIILYIILIITLIYSRMKQCIENLDFIKETREYFYCLFMDLFYYSCLYFSLFRVICLVTGEEKGFIYSIPVSNETYLNKTKEPLKHIINPLSFYYIIKLIDCFLFKSQEYYLKLLSYSCLMIGIHVSEEYSSNFQSSKTTKICFFFFVFYCFFAFLREILLVNDEFLCYNQSAFSKRNYDIYSYNFKFRLIFLVFLSMTMIILVSFIKNEVSFLVFVEKYEFFCFFYIFLLSFVVSIVWIHKIIYFLCQSNNQNRKKIEINEKYQGFEVDLRFDSNEDGEIGGGSYDYEYE